MKKIDDGDKSEIGQHMTEFFDGHVRKHPMDKVEAAVILVANLEEKEGQEFLHVCQFSGGNARQLAEIMVEALDQLQEQLPGFTECFQKLVMAKHAEQFIDKMSDALDALKKSTSKVKGSKPVRRDPFAEPTQDQLNEASNVVDIALAAAKRGGKDDGGGTLH